MDNKREGNIYNKIVKENIERIIPALMNSVLGFKVLDSTVIREKLQQTKEKEADVLRIITDQVVERFFPRSVSLPYHLVTAMFLVDWCLIFK